MRRAKLPRQSAPAIPWAAAKAVAGVQEPTPQLAGTFHGGAIYIARAKSGHIKIGCSASPALRVNEFMKRSRGHLAAIGVDASQVDLLLVVKDAAGFRRERALHKRFVAELVHASSREWFKGPQIESFVAALLTRANEGAAA